jgi:methionyl-tRNA formyltransferase
MSQSDLRQNGAAGAPRVLFLGMAGAFSLAPLRALVEDGIAVAAVLLPDDQPGARGGLRPLPPVLPPRSTLPLLTPHVAPSIVTLAWERGVPAYALARREDCAALEALGALGADVICVACWPWKLPATLRDVAPHGALNVHPALLPAHRGPAPLFWTLRAGDPTGGVTIHRMDDTLDGGAIVAQEPVPLIEGEAGDALERRCAVAGGRLLAASVRALALGAAQPVPQGAGGGYEPRPQAADFAIPLDRPARWAFNFIRGTAYWGEAHTLAVEGARHHIRAALGYDEHATLEAPLVREGARLRVRCAPGVLDVLADPLSDSPPFPGEGLGERSRL